MPVFQSGHGRSPHWCEMDYFEILKLEPGESRRFERAADKEKLIVTEGRCRFIVDGKSVEAEEQTQVDINSVMNGCDVVDVTSATTIVRMCGRWGTELGGSGIFQVVHSEEPQDKGDAVSYPKQTNFDSHYHDCDEFWILVEGHGNAVSECKHYEVKVGDCIATSSGFHHDFPFVYEPVKAIYFETTMKGLKRQGHLWEHTHGPAEPVLERGLKDGI